MTNKKHKARQKIIKSYLFKSYRNNFKNIANKNDYLIVKNSYNFCKLVLPVSALFSVFSYKYFFTGIYEFRSFYLNTSSIPLAFKIMFASSIGYYIFVKLWVDFVYNEDIYEMAVKDLKNTNMVKENQVTTTAENKNEKEKIIL
jgi:hypothetical protein